MDKRADTIIKYFESVNGVGDAPARDFCEVTFNGVQMARFDQFPYTKVEEYKGFELWKSNKGARGDSCIRYVEFKNIHINNNAKSYLIGHGLSRLLFYRVNITSLKVLKEYINKCIAIM